MEFSVFGVIGAIAVIAVAAFAPKLGVAAPLLLVVVGIGYSFIPGVPQLSVPPEVILTGLLPPLLYSAAITVPVVDFRRNIRGIGALSVLLVIVSAFGTGTFLFVVFPDLSFPAAIGLGAVISPPDVVAATAIGRRLGLPPRLVTLLEGEGLLNDATALVLLRTAIAATAAEVTFWGASVDFLYAASVAVVIGVAIGVITVWVRTKLKDPVLDTAVSFAVPFLAFIPAEAINASGVIAVVVAGLYAGHNSAKHFTAQARISERLNWRTAQFVIENGVFFLMGVQIRPILGAVERESLSVGAAIGLGLVCVLILLGIRFLFVGTLLVQLRWRERAGSSLERMTVVLARSIARLRDQRDGDTRKRSVRRERRLSRAERFHRRRTVDIARLQSEGLGWKGGVILSWAGMRGVVTLAAAQSLPEDIPYRPQLILIAFTVAIATLLVQGGTLPLIIRASGVQGTDRAADRRELATLLDEIGAAGILVLEKPELSVPTDLDPDVIDRVRHDTLLGAESAWERADHGGGADAIARSPHRQYRELRREVLRAERAALLEARREGVYSSRILMRAQAMLDLEETRLEQIDNPSGSP